MVFSGGAPLFLFSLLKLVLVKCSQCSLHYSLIFVVIRFGFINDILYVNICDTIQIVVPTKKIPVFSIEINAKSTRCQH
jgi:hypothetical protein